MIESLFFILLVLFLLIIERKNIPLLAIGYPIVFCVLLHLIFSGSYGFLPLKPIFYLVTFIGIVSFWFGSVNFFGNTGFKNISFKLKYHSLINWVALIISIIFIFKITELKSSNSYEFYLSTTVFLNDFFTNPFYEFGRSFLMITITINIAFYRKKLLDLIILVWLVFILLIFQIKGMIIMPILAGLLIRFDTFDFRKFSKILFLVFILGYSVFFLNYNIYLLDSFEYSMFEKVNSKIFSYIFAGIEGISYSNYINSPNLGISYILAPINNILRHIFGWERLIIDNSNYYLSMTNIRSPIAYKTNVLTMFGTIYANTNIFVLIIYSFVIGVIGRFLLNFKNHNIWLKISYAFFVSTLSYAFFEYYFWHQYIITLIFLPLVLGSLKLISKNK